MPAENGERGTTEGERTPDARPLPPLSREALQRIEQAERAAREHYDRDKWPHFPTNPKFSFLEMSIRRALASIIEYLRMFAEEILDAHLNEYLAIAPWEVLSNSTLARSVVDRVFDLTSELWRGYQATLFLEPSRRKAQFSIALLEGKLG